MSKTSNKLSVLRIHGIGRVRLYHALQPPSNPRTLCIDGHRHLYYAVEGSPPSASPISTVHCRSIVEEVRHECWSAVLNPGDSGTRYPPTNLRICKSRLLPI